MSKKRASSTALNASKKAKTSSSKSMFAIRPFHAPDQVDSRRCQTLFKSNQRSKIISLEKSKSPILYWMSRDQRIEDNWALLRCFDHAKAQKTNVAIVFCLTKTFPDATERTYGFMLDGLQELEENCREKGIPFYLKQGDCTVKVPELARELKINTLITDYSPMRFAREWRSVVADKLKAIDSFQLFEEVDAHNVVPVWHASPKLEYSARTLRSKLAKGLLDEFVCEFPAIPEQPRKAELPPTPDWKAIRKWVEADKSVPTVNWLKSGCLSARKQLESFCSASRLGAYTERNIPTKKHSQSGLSPYLHFGQIASQRAVLEVLKVRQLNREAADSFLEEIIVRKELADNFCHYNANYDKLEGASQWAQDSLLAHASDKREFLYTYEEWRDGKTHDSLWNAAQHELRVDGKLHGFMRMYWAKKILEWSGSPQEAIEIALRLNDRYSLDGRDPNGVVGVMWSICGIHDQGWRERPVFGKVRYMNYAGCKRKFDVDLYVAQQESTQTKIK